MKGLKRRLRHTNDHQPARPASPADAEHLPSDPRTGQPLPPRAQPGYYPGFSTLSQQPFWDEATRTVVTKRIEQVPPIRFFTPDEARLLEAVAARILPQDDRDDAHTIPIVPTIDERLWSGRIDGYRFEGMPPDPDAHRLGLQAIEAIAQHLYGRGFTALEPLEQDRVLQTLHDNEPPAAHDIWPHMPAKRFWMLLVQDVIEVYYAHPYAWDEIGFGGPAYPRGYMRLENGQPEPWEVDEQRYDWVAPHDSLSDRYEPIGKQEAEHDTITPGQEGSH